MDPDVCRAKVIESANLVLNLGQRAEANTDTFTNVAIELAEAVHDLDEWLRMDGFPPAAWKSLHARATGKGGGPLRRDVDIAVDEPRVSLTATLPSGEVIGQWTTSESGEHHG